MSDRKCIIFIHKTWHQYIAHMLQTIKLLYHVYTFTVTMVIIHLPNAQLPSWLLIVNFVKMQEVLYNEL